MASEDLADDVNSSDEEFETPQNPFAKAGLRAVNAILDRGNKLRSKSKKAAREMVPDAGAPPTRSSRAY
jgi:hypothetical protein